MLKVYLISVIIWFLIIVISGLLLENKFIKSRNKINKALKVNPKEKWGYIKTTLWYLGISFIPVVRIIVLITKLIMTFRPDEIIKMSKEIEEREKNGK